MTNVVFNQMYFLTVGSKQKNKNENTEYYSMFIPFKSQAYSRQGNPIFLLFGSWSLILYLHVWLKSIFFQSNLTILVDVQRCMKTIYDVYFAVPHCFIKIFHLQQSQILHDATIPAARTKDKSREFLFI